MFDILFIADLPKALIALNCYLQGAQPFADLLTVFFDTSESRYCLPSLHASPRMELYGPARDTPSVQQRLLGHHRQSRVALSMLQSGQQATSQNT